MSFQKKPKAPRQKPAIPKLSPRQQEALAVKKNALPSNNIGRLYQKAVLDPETPKRGGYKTR